AYSEKNTIQIWSGKHGKRESHRDASSDENCNEMREHIWKDEKGLSMVSQRRGKQLQRRLNSEQTQGDAVPNMSRNLRKK
ncbi:unnamed protein product, partial [Brassica rapa]